MQIPPHTTFSKDNSCLAVCHAFDAARLGRSQSDTTIYKRFKNSLNYTQYILINLLLIRFKHNHHLFDTVLNSNHKVVAYGA